MTAMESPFAAHPLGQQLIEMAKKGNVEAIAWEPIPPHRRPVRVRRFDFDRIILCIQRFNLNLLFGLNLIILC
jgi:hypothetical protein